MSTIKDAINQARANAQDLHKQVMAATGKDQAAIKNDFTNVSTDAQALANSIKETAAAQAQQSDTRAYLSDAVAQIQDAANHAKAAAQAAAPEFSKAKATVIADMTNGLNSLSHAVATQRAAQPGARS